MRTVAIIQARMRSSRLPGKVLAKLAGRPVLGWVVRAARAVPGVDAVVIATSTAAQDDTIVSWCSQHDVECFRGSEQDVLDRYAGAARAARADVVLRITSDCPFFDPQIGGQVVALRRLANTDYAGNVDPPSWPDGLDCECVTAAALLAAGAEATRAFDREHVIPFIRNNRARFSTRTLHASLPGLAQHRWTLDTAADYEFLQAVARHLHPDRPPGFLEVLAVLDAHPAYRAINAAHMRDEGAAKSRAVEKIAPGRSYAESQRLLERAERSIPLGSQTFSKSRIQFPASASPMFLTHGSGGRCWDVDGNEYVDLINSLMPNVLGYRDPDVDEAIRQQLDQGITFSLASPLEAEVAETLCRHIPCAEMVRFGKNGTDATSGAVRLARAYTGRDRLLMCGYHGWQDWYIGATTRNRGVPAAVSELSRVVPYNNLDAVDRAFRDRPGEIAALILEPAGVNTPEGNFLAELKQLVHRHGALLVFDEIVTGLRWGIGGAQERYGVTPDLAAFGKALGNGMPIAAVVGRAEVMHLMEEIFFSSTFGGETLSLAATRAVLAKFEREPVVDKLWRNGQTLMDAARERIAACGLQGQISLIGSAPWAVLAYKDHESASAAAIKTLLLREMLSCGVLINASHNVCYAHDENDLHRVLGAYEHSLAVVREALDSGDLMRRIGNQTIQPVFQVRSVN
jgi:glutamate-1-semialdehyde 2,1-aminomutase/spore coat polysaccharide biosynthesis protein SpsF